MSFIPYNQTAIPGCTWIPGINSTEKVQEITLQFGDNAEELPMADSRTDRFPNTSF